MAQANVDPGDLRRFAMDLKRFNNELQTLLSALHARSHGLARTWRDQEHHKFAQELDQTIKSLSKFVESSEEHAAFLLRKAARIEEYLQQR